MLSKSQFFAAATLLLAVPLRAQGPNPNEVPPSRAVPHLSAAERVAAGIDSPDLRGLIAEVIERNPGLAALHANARAAEEGAGGAGALPDPEAGLTAFLAPPETRTGAQRLSISVLQGIPWAGKRGLREQAAHQSAAVRREGVEAEKLRIVTEVRRLLLELTYQDHLRHISDHFRGHLVQHEEIARVRYSTGVGLGQAVIKIHAEITRAEADLLAIDLRRAELSAQLNSLRDRPVPTQLPVYPEEELAEVQLELTLLLSRARSARPEVAAADARIARADSLARLAEKNRRPDLRVGFSYTLVEARDDPLAQIQPPQGNGDDIFGVHGGLTLPIWRRKLTAEVRQAVELRAVAEEEKRRVLLGIETEIGELLLRVPLNWRRLRLVEELLVLQAEEALESAQAGYVAGTLNALDLLHAEHVLFDARAEVARARADYLINLAELEGAVGEPLTAVETTERGES